MIDPNGIAHIQLTVRDLERSKPFYRVLLHETFGMTIQYDDARSFYCIGGRTGVLLTQSRTGDQGPFDQQRIGLHHFCFRLRSREDIDTLHGALVKFGAKVVRAPEDGDWAPGYYSLLFEDPDGIRIEANFVPGRGNLDVIKGEPLTRPASLG